VSIIINNHRDYLYQQFVIAEVSDHTRELHENLKQPRYRTAKMPLADWLSSLYEDVASTFSAPNDVHAEAPAKDEDEDKAEGGEEGSDGKEDSESGDQDGGEDEGEENSEEEEEEEEEPEDPKPKIEEGKS
jgi:hypothetical protein